MTKSIPFKYLFIAFVLMNVAGYFVCADASEHGYKLGQGYRIDQTGLVIGGYIHIDYENFENQNGKLKLDDASLFLSWKIRPWLRFFTELEFEDSVTIERNSIDTDDSNFSVERLYLDFLTSEWSTLRLGKFLTPVGYWNEIHAAPLVWTTSRPLVTERPFAKHATGIMLHGTIPISDLDLDLDYAVFADDSNDLDPKKIDVNFNNALGGRLRLSLSNFTSIGVSYVNFRSDQLKNNPNYNLLGLDFRFRRSQFEITSELTYRFSNKTSEQKGLYLQMVAPLGKNFFAVGRYEYFDDGELSPDVHLGIAGLAYRPIPGLVLKAEYRVGRHNSETAPSGFLTSFSILF
jgi:hypothetical protein